MACARPSVAPGKPVVPGASRVSTHALAGKSPGPKAEEALFETMQERKPAATPQIARMQEEQEKFRTKADAEKRKLLELERQAEELETKLMQRRKKLGGPNAPRESAAQVKKQIKILDHRLEKALAKHNHTLASNKRLREGIDNMRRERIVFAQLYKKLEKELQEKKKEMVHIIDVSNRAYEAREAAVEEMARLKQQADREHQVFEGEFRELGRLIEHDRKMRDYMKLKSKDQEELMRSSNGDDGHKKRSVVRASAAMHTGSGQLASVSADKGEMMSYSEAFTKIQHATGIEEFDELMMTFINAEDENYRHYKYIDELTQEIERLKEQIVGVQEEIEQYATGDQDESAQQERELAAAKAALTATESNITKYSAKQTAAEALLDTLTVGMGNAVKLMGCAHELGPDGVTQRNMMVALSAVEQQCTRLLQQYTREQKPKPPPPMRELPPGVAVTIEAPSSTDKVEDEEEASDDEEIDHPLTRAELELRTLKTLKKRDDAAAKKHAAKLVKPPL